MNGLRKYLCQDTGTNPIAITLGDPNSSEYLFNISRYHFRVGGENPRFEMFWILISVKFAVAVLSSALLGVLRGSQSLKSEVSANL